MNDGGGISRSDWTREQGADSEPTGKPYTWQIALRENPEMLALTPAVLAERAFVKSATFRTVLERTAAYFVVVSRNNGYEGRDPRVVTDDVRCGAVSQFLGIDIELLARALLEMQRKGLVSTGDDGNLRLDDLEAIDRLSEGAQPF
jgi:hypothetical protein